MSWPISVTCQHGVDRMNGCCAACGDSVPAFSTDKAKDLLLNQASIYGTAQELARMADTQGQREIAENIVKSLSRAVLDAAELYYQSLKP